MGSVVLTRFCLGLCIKTRSVLGMFLLIRENLFCWPQFGPTAIAVFFFFPQAILDPSPFYLLLPSIPFFFIPIFYLGKIFFFGPPSFNLKVPKLKIEKGKNLFRNCSKQNIVMIKEVKIRPFTQLVNSKWKKDWLKEMGNCLFTKLCK